MASAPYILARTMKDAHSFAREELGLAHGKYRIVNSPGTIKSVRGADLYLVPGYQNRFDRFAIKGAIRWTRMNVIDVAKIRAEVPAFIVTAVPDDTEPPASHIKLVNRVLGGVRDDLQPAGEQLLIPVDDEEASAFVTAIDPAILVDAPSPDDIVSETKRRRSRCKNCGTLHFKTDPCPDDPFPGT